MSTLKYIQVINDINQVLRASELSENIGLHSGTSGIALFLAYYDRIICQKTNISQRVLNILEHNVAQINSGVQLHTICNGISGFCWLCEHLRKQGMLREEDIEFLNDLDSFLYQRMIADIRMGIYDFLHGALGIGAYFLTRFNKKEVPLYLEELLSELEKLGVSCENGAIKWMSVLNAKNGGSGFNISLSHGMSSIIAFLVRLYQLNFETERVNKLLNGAIIYILDQMANTDKYLSYFPSVSKESVLINYQSRLGWCYGDLGIAHVLWQAGVILKNKDWENTALQILHHTTNRRDLQKNHIKDARFCHGSAGVVHIFNNLYLKTGLQEFRDTADYWLQITMQMAKYNDGLAGFKAWRKEEYGGPENSFSLLDGISGIGMVLLSHQFDIIDTNWDACFMLS